MFIHLTTHSAYSLQEGLAQPAELARAAAEAGRPQAARANSRRNDSGGIGMPALGLTDHRLLSGAVEFVRACKEAGVQPVLGLEMSTSSANSRRHSREPDGPLSLLAMNLEGWANLCRLSSALALREAPDEACSTDLLAQYSGDLIALRGEAPQSAGTGGQVPRNGWGPCRIFSRTACMRP